MLHIDATMEDTRLIARANAQSIWHILLNDNLTGKQHETYWDNEQFAAVLATAIAGDDEGATPEQRALAEHLFKDVPNECRLIP
jgi:hypothetical protein